MANHPGANNQGSSGPPAGGQGQNKGKKRVITLNMSLPTLISSTLALIIGVIWVFILGVIIGRGQVAEENANTMAALKGLPAAAAHDSAPPASSVIRPEDLRYRDNLRQDTQADATRAASQTAARSLGQSVVQASARPAPTVAPVASAPPQTAPQPVAPVAAPSPPAPAATPTTTPPAAAAQVANPGPGPSPVPAGAAAPSASSGGQIFDYTYQVAAFRDEAQAKKLQASLRQARINSNVERQEQSGVVWYKVITPFRGTPEETRILKKALVDQGLSGNPIMKSKTPYNP